MKQIVRTQQEIDAVIDKANKSFNEGSAFKGESYEAGLKSMYEWLTQEDAYDPFDEAEGTINRALYNLKRDRIKKVVLPMIAEKSSMAMVNIKEDHGLQNDCGFDSMDEIELMILLENEFSIAIPDGAFDSVKTVADVIDYLFNKVQ